jgi:hypothetical protein
MMSLTPPGNEDLNMSPKLFDHVCEQNGTIKELRNTISCSLGFRRGVQWDTCAHRADANGNTLEIMCY